MPAPYSDETPTKSGVYSREVCNYLWRMNYTGNDTSAFPLNRIMKDICLYRYIRVYVVFLEEKVLMWTVLLVH